ncbi:Protein of unknown function [Pyronema omphalodes CBS 100304]|uniref:Uncharacterized protein n=1 Tax=Pyronema omphalodes (strain CBS 100304) TaxID=1076935 RepID=U4LK20_PYROM|nr:Protein of unknown function [Pyronema omphalodes CBS 100304]
MLPPTLPQDPNPDIQSSHLTHLAQIFSTTPKIYIVITAIGYICFCAFTVKGLIREVSARPASADQV